MSYDCRIVFSVVEESTPPGSEQFSGKAQRMNGIAANKTAWAGRARLPFGYRAPRIGVGSIAKSIALPLAHSKRLDSPRSDRLY